MAFRSDGLDNPLSPNGSHLLYYVETESGERRGPFSCLAEAQEHTDSEWDTVEDHHGRPVERNDC